MRRRFVVRVGLSALSLFVALAGCSTVNELKKPGAELGPGYGYVAARIVSMAGPEPSGEPNNFPPLVRVYYKLIKSDKFSIGSDFTIEADLQNATRTVGKGNVTVSGEMVLVRAQPGQYHLSSLLGKSLGRTIEIQAKDSPPFTVNEGEVTYVGQIHLITRVGRNAFGTVVPSSGIFSLSHDFETDVAELKKRDPRLASMRITDARLRQESQIASD